MGQRVTASQDGFHRGRSVGRMSTYTNCKCTRGFLTCALSIVSQRRDVTRIDS